MTLDELISEIENLTSDDSVQDILLCLKEWKDNHKTVLELDNTIEKFRDFSWPKESEHALLKVLQLLYNFQSENIANIGGMTMNERLYLFSLLDKFDSGNKNKKEMIYIKLLGGKESR